MVPLRSLMVLLIVGCATSATGQATMRVGPGDGPPRGPAAPQRGERMQADREERVRALHDVLAIQPGQEAAFSAFVAAMRPPMDQRGEGRGDEADRAGAPAAMTTPQRLAMMKTRMDAQMERKREAFARLSAATLALYGVLDAHQRQVMDALPQLSGEGRPGMDRHHHMG